MNDSNRKNGMAQTSNGPQWVKTDDKRSPNILNPNQREVSPTFLGLNPMGFNASSFIPKSLSPKQAPKGKKVLAKGRAASNISKTTVESNHHKFASFTPINHCASSSSMGAKMGNHSGGSCCGSVTSGEGSGKDNKVAAMKVVQFSAQ